MSSGKVLVVEDDGNIRALLDAYLASSGFDVVSVEDGEAGLEAARTGGFALLLLDVMLPGLSGYEIAQALRAQDDPTPILFLTARGAEADVLEGFAVGADDYVVKPFSPRELVARCRAIIARQATKQVAKPVSRLLVDRQGLQCRMDGAEIQLTAHEFRLLSQLSAAPGRVFDRDQLTTALYPNGEAIGPKAIDVHIHNLRKKLGGEGASIIQTVRGFGYRFSEPRT